MRKYVMIFLASIMLLEIMSIVVYWDALKAYISSTVSGLTGGVLYLAIYVFAFYLLIRALFR